MIEVIVFLVALVSLILAVKWAVQGDWRKLGEVRDYQPPKPYDLYSHDDVIIIEPEEETEEMTPIIEPEEETEGKRMVYRVVPYKGDDERDWAVKRDKRVIKTYSRKADAIRGGRVLAKSHKKGQLVIHKRDGTIQTEYTYGADPRKSKG